ncbi:MAG TPA: hypothetical protein VNN73_17710 [Blastocatellia bacterium]|nr:hypothetical protein [Blastocatellia bacterium]
MSKISIAIILLVSFVTITQAQSKKPPQKSQAALAKDVAEASAKLVSASKAYKESLERLLALEQEEANLAAEKVEQRKKLLEQGIISKLELEQSERELAAAQAKVAATRKQIGETDDMIAEAAAEEKLARMGPARVGAYQSTAALIRYNGPTRWVIADAVKVESFFLSRFNRALPISAFGQTSVHNSLGFDHSNSIDVAVHPDSAEGQALMSYLRAAGIPFLAFRQAVAGVATGAHIHIGYPSHRIR